METNRLRLRSGSAGSSVLPLLAALSLSMIAPAAVAQIAFEDATSSANIARSGESFGASFGDLNGDGYLEIFSSNHRRQPTLYLNRGGTKFVNIAPQVKPFLYRPTADTHGSSWFDFDNDGDQDLSVGLGTGNLPYFLVNEYGRLVDRALEAGLDQWLKGNRLPLWLDYDGDRLPDLVWANHGGIARLFRQDRPGHFIDQTDATRFNCLRTHYGHLVDVTEDGRLDYMCPKIEQFPLRIWDTYPTIWRKLFDNLTPDDPRWVKFPLVPAVVDSTLADFDNDGRLDMFLLSHATLEPSGVARGSSTHLEAKLAGGNKGFKFAGSGKVKFDIDWNRADEGIPIHIARYKIGADGHPPPALPFTLDPATDSSVVGIVDPPTTSEELPMMRIGFDPATQQWTLVLHTQLESGAYYFSEAYLQVDSTQAITNLVSIGLWPNDEPGRPTL
ncbi:MAG TPA: VCBS repeat-containing protein, partial [Anaerolineae bacterium]|nr:VCBS repeat-containing protein [Anaerolineae bacterium]